MRPQRRFGLFVTFTISAVLLTLTRSATAETAITVNSFHDDVTINGNCTLREAIIAANTDAPVDACPAGSGADTILLPAGVYMLSQTGPCDDAAATGDLDISGDLTMVGAGATTTVIHGGSLDYPLSDRVIHVLGDGHLVLSGVTVRGGVAGLGGGIFNQGVLEVEACRVRGNIVRYQADVCPTPRGLGGAGIYNMGELTIRDSVVSGNQVWGSYSGDVDSPGGGLLNSGNAVVEASTFSGNWAAGGAGISNGGTLTVIESHLSSNGARFWGAGLENAGQATLSRTTVDGNTDSGIYNSSHGMLTLTDSTVSGNQGYRIAGGIINEGMMEATNCTISGNDGPIGGISPGRSALTNCTVTDNSGWMAGGIGSASSATRLEATIVAHNAGPATDCSGPVTSLGYNLDSDGSCGLSGPGDLPNASVSLGFLANNGGPTQTHALLAGSPAIDAVPTEICPLITDQGMQVAKDQRGVGRPQGAGCDSGAYEADPSQLIQQLMIDIRPKTAENLIDVEKMGAISVAVLSAPNFNAPAALDWRSLRFGRTGNEDSLHWTSGAISPACTSADVSGDGLADLVCSFKLAATTLQCDDTAGTLTGKLVGIGTIPMTARDAVVIRPCP